MFVVNLSWFKITNEKFGVFDSWVGLRSVVEESIRAFLILLVSCVHWYNDVEQLIILVFENLENVRSDIPESAKLFAKEPDTVCSYKVWHY